MFVRKKKNASGVISVQVIDKSSGKYKVLKTIGCSSDPLEIDQLYRQAFIEIPKLNGQHQLDFDKGSEQAFIDEVVNSITAIYLQGPELLLGKLFNEIGFSAIKDSLFRHLV